MSDTDTGKVLPWNEEAKFQFLLRIVAQLQDDGKSINWGRIKMAGRTTKSLQNMWTKVRKLIANLDEVEDSEQPVATPKKRGPRKAKTTKKSDSIKGEDDDDATPEATPKKTPRKRASEGGPKRAYTKRAKKERVEDADPIKVEPMQDAASMDHLA